MSRVFVRRARPRCSSTCSNQGITESAIPLLCRNLARTVSLSQSVDDAFLSFTSKTEIRLGLYNNCSTWFQWPQRSLPPGKGFGRVEYNE